MNKEFWIILFFIFLAGFLMLLGNHPILALLPGFLACVALLRTQ